MPKTSFHCIYNEYLQKIGVEFEMNILYSQNIHFQKQAIFSEYSLDILCKCIYTEYFIFTGYSLDIQNNSQQQHAIVSSMTFSRETPRRSRLLTNNQE